MRDRGKISHDGKTPEISEDVFLADGSRVIGHVKIGEKSSIWFNTVIRGDIEPVVVGVGTNIQDNSTLHVGHGYPCLVGSHVTVGHNVILHGCTVGDHCLIGMGAILLNGSEIGEYSIVAAGSLIPEGKVFPPRSLIMGSPAKVVRAVGEDEVEKMIFRASRGYQIRGQEFLNDQREEEKEWKER